MPLFLWALYGTAIIQVLATPVLAITLLLLAVERDLGIGIFDPALGGDPILFQHFFWFYSHPAVYIMILPAMGIITEVISVFSHKHIFGYKFIAYSSLAIALIGFLVWGHHMFVSGQSPLVGMIFSALTFAVAIPSAIKVFNWLATMYKGSITLAPPMCFALMFIVLFGIGGLTGLFLGSLAINVHVHDTAFVVAHFHYTMAGGALMGFLAGLYYWWPKITGRMYSLVLGQVSAVDDFRRLQFHLLPAVHHRLARNAAAILRLHQAAGGAPRVHVLPDTLVDRRLFVRGGIDSGGVSRFCDRCSSARRRRQTRGRRTLGMAVQFAPAARERRCPGRGGRLLRL